MSLEVATHSKMNASATLSAGHVYTSIPICYGNNFQVCCEWEYMRESFISRTTGECKLLLAVQCALSIVKKNDVP